MLAGSVTAPGTPSGLACTWVAVISCCLLPRSGDRARSRVRGAGERLVLVVLRGLQLAELATHALARLAQLVLELSQLAGAAADELELAVDVAERLLQQLAAALRRSTSSRRSCARTSARASSAVSSVFSSSRETPSRSFRRITSRRRSTSASRVEPVLTRRPRGRLGEQPDLLVVADRARRGADQAGDVADAQAELARRLTACSPTLARRQLVGAAALGRCGRGAGAAGTRTCRAARPPRAPTGRRACWR